mgnify:CR=1 FL=1
MKSLFILFVSIQVTEKDLFAAEVGMPQLDPKYWASQAFWLILVFTIMYITISKHFIPKIKKNLDNRDNKIKEDLDEAKNLNELSEKKQKEYEEILNNSKKEVIKILYDSKKKLDKDILSKKNKIDKEIEKEVEKIQIEIFELKKSSINSIDKISEEITSKIIEDISGDKLNESSVKATVEEISKKNMVKYL